MKQLVSKRWVVMCAVVAGLVCTWIGLQAGAPCTSGMIFSIKKDLTGPGAFPEDGTNPLSLPYKFQQGLTNASGLLDDIGGAACDGSGPVLSIASYVKTAAGLEDVYTGCAGPNFLLDMGKAYFVKVNTDFTYYIVGAHSPGCVIPLTGPGAFPEDGSNLYSHPFHGVSTVASELVDEIGGPACDGSGPVLSIARYVKAVAGLEDVYTGCAGPNFGLQAGEGYYVKVNANVDFVPMHL